MWFLRCMRKISWKHKNEKWRCSKRISKQKTLIDRIKTRKLKFFRHTKRHYSIMKNTLKGWMEGNSPLGRPRAHSCGNIKEWSGHSLLECTRLANQQEMWHQIFSQPWSQDGTVESASASPATCTEFMRIYRFCLFKLRRYPHFFSPLKFGQIQIYFFLWNHEEVTFFPKNYRLNVK